MVVITTIFLNTPNWNDGTTEPMASTEINCPSFSWCDRFVYRTRHDYSRLCMDTVISILHNYTYPNLRQYLPPRKLDSPKL